MSREESPPLAALTREEVVERIGDFLDRYDDASEDPHHAASRLLAELQTLGLVLVPREPTEGMILAGVKEVMSESPQTDIREAWEVMLSSSPFAGN